MKPDNGSAQIFPPIVQIDFMRDPIFCIGVMCRADDNPFEVGTTMRARKNENKKKIVSRNSNLGFAEVA